jgi:hypothetical protein
MQRRGAEDDSMPPLSSSATLKPALFSTLVAATHVAATHVAVTNEQNQEVAHPLRSMLALSAKAFARTIAACLPALWCAVAWARVAATQKPGVASP